MVEPMFPVENNTWQEKLRSKLPLIFIVIAILMILNFVITYFYIKSNQDLSTLLKVCDPIKICHPGGG
jgi:uncharacterized membrane protein